MRALPDLVTIEQWTHPAYGWRWSIFDDDGRVILTFPTELEARRQCRESGWVVRRPRLDFGEGQPDDR